MRFRSAPLAVTGIGAVSALVPGGIATGSELADALEAGRRGIGRIEPGELPAVAAALRARRRGSEEEADWAGRVGDFDPSAFISPRQARRLDRASLFALAATHRALAEAGLTDSAAIEHDLAVLVGTSSAGSTPLTSFLVPLLRQSPDAAPPFEFPNTVANAPASHVSIQLGLKGPNATLVHSEAVVAQLLVQAGMMAADGRCSALLIGAADEWSPYTHVGYDHLRALRHRPDGGGGMLLAEGAALLVAEPEEAAVERGAPVQARITGWSTASASGEPFRWIADADALERALAGALAAAGRRAGEVGSVVLAANGVEPMERAEAHALERLLPRGPVVATGVKGAIGERATAGVVSVAAAVLARVRGVLPPFAGSALSAWPASIRPATGPVALPPGPTLVVLTGFGGNYGAVVVE